MAITIKTGPDGKEVICSEVAGKAALLPTENLYVRMGDGHCFVAVPATPGMERLRPHEVAMVEYWLRERASEIVTTVFAGEPPLVMAEAEEATEPAPDG